MRHISSAKNINKTKCTGFEFGIVFLQIISGMEFVLCIGNTKPFFNWRARVTSSIDCGLNLNAQRLSQFVVDCAQMQ